MAINTLYQHCSILNKPINFDPNNPFEKTQDLQPIQRYIYSTMGWKRTTYVKSRVEGFQGLFPGNMALVEASMLAGLLIKYEEDFILCSKIEEAMWTVPKADISFLQNNYNYKQKDTISNIFSINPSL